MAKTWALKNALVMVAGDQPATRQDIVIYKNRIAAIGPNLDFEALGVTQATDCSDLLVLPGLINTHYHSHDRWDRGRFDTMPLEIWMNLYNPPTYGRNWTPDEIYLRTILGGMELIRGGSTAVLDDVHLGLQLDDGSIDAVFRAYEDLGIRANVGIAFSDIPGHETIPYLDDVLPQKFKTKGQTAARSCDEMLALWEKLAAQHTGRVRSVVSVSGPQRCTVGFQQAAQDLARKIERPVLTHVLETRIQAMTAHKFFGCSMIEHMDQIGVLDDNTVVIHGVWQTADDLDRVAAAGAGVSHNPLSNTKLGSGIAPLRPMLERGIPVGLGTDNHNANDSCSMFEALKFGSLLQPLLSEDYTKWLTASEALTMGSRNGACLMGQAKDIGQLKVGMKADFITFSLLADAFWPLNNPAVQTVFANSTQALRDVVVDGQFVLQDGLFQSVNENDIRQEIQGRIEVIQRKVLGGVPDSQAMEKYLHKANHACMQDALMKPYKGRCNCCP